MGKKRLRNRGDRGGSRTSGGSMGALFMAALGNSDSDFAKETRSVVEQASASRAAEDRKRRMADATKNLLLLPHTSGSGRFVNPYTFFPLEDDGPQRWDIDEREHSGKLSCVVRVQGWSPLFIPNTSGVFTKQVKEKEGEVHKSYDFYSYDDLSEVASRCDSLQGSGPAQPVIPGSELRGMTRGVYEQLTNSCLPIIDEKSNPIKRTNLPKHAYRMEYDASTGVWKLYETETYKLGARHNYLRINLTNRSGKVLHNGFRAYERLRDDYEDQWDAANGKVSRQILACDPAARGPYRNEVSLAPSSADAGYYLHATGEIGGRENHNHLLLYPCANAQAGRELCSLAETDDVFIRFMRVLDAYCEETSIPNHNKVVKIYKAYRALVQRHETVLVYADEGKNPAHLAPSCMSPESYGTRIVDLLNHHKPCAGPVFCPACRLFGMVGAKAQVGSRVRFSDARVNEDVGFEFLAPTTLAPLSTPRPSATEFYLRRPDDVTDGVWNYDYVLRGDGETLTKDPKPYRDMPGAGIQGRKVYVHSRFDLAARYTADAFVPSTQNMTVRPLKSGEFTFDVHFRDLTSHELATLVYALGGMGGRLQKLGHGRPLGMGSVLVQVVECQTKTYAYDAERGITCSKSSLDAEWFERNLPTDERSVARRKLVTFLSQDLEQVEYEGNRTLGDVVSYPKPKGGPICGNVQDKVARNQTFTWFGKNRGSVLKPEFRSVLETLSVEDVMRDGSTWQDLPE